MIEQSWPEIEAIVSKLTPDERDEVLARLTRLLAADRSPETEAERQKRKAFELQAKLAQIPVTTSDDNWSSKDHDKILYGGKW